ncbi:hypothetical protein ACFFF5_06885 [Lederbergia wuyishanensis]|uniref:Uncharacterized protein n=1 Tax=Lederbergia wuyishanensis TaxID=1347903 RepID=A0ABU0D2J9_9BACI|nr:hypothetical protein [Lederbergia wuyishanensis]MCJ8007214.1 hypothetical protein [Lederbergia wuyishanensis]MDQ0342637.1 hypothetical protein [Lederbergia wuyishanensis]
MRKKHLLLIIVLFVLLTSFAPSKAMATSWAYPFVVWDGYIYVISEDEYVTEIGDKIGQVTRHSDMEQYSGNFSNAYKKGTIYYSIEGVSTDEAIAIEESGGRNIKAYREGEYEIRSVFGEIVKVFIFSILGILAVILVYKILRTIVAKGNHYH